MASLASCAASSDGDVAGDVSSIVGGQPEAGTPAAGYVTLRLKTKGGFKGRICSAILIAPDVAVTAAHCFWSAEQGVARGLPCKFAFAFGIGDVDDIDVIPAKSVIIHPKYQPNFGGPDDPVVDWHYDVAVMKLESPSKVEPLQIGAAEVGMKAKSIGYGRSSPQPGSGRDRKSLLVEVTSIADTYIAAKGADGATCSGDSGGPLIDVASNRLLGVLRGGVECLVNTESYWMSLHRMLDFVEAAKTCQTEDLFLGLLPKECPIH